MDCPGRVLEEVGLKEVRAAQGEASTLLSLLVRVQTKLERGRVLASLITA